ncbi:MAG: hypothetical protein QM713_08340 [Arachnia sp.]
MRTRAKFWTTWPGAVVMGLVALAVSAPGATVAALWLLVPAYDGSAIDFEVAAPSPIWSVVAAAAVVMSLVLAALTVYWSRRKWAGYVLLGIGLSFAVGVVGLFVWGIL